VRPSQEFRIKWQGREKAFAKKNRQSESVEEEKKKPFRISPCFWVSHVVTYYGIPENGLLRSFEGK